MDEHEISLLPLQLNWKSHDIYVVSAAIFCGIRENKDVWGRSVCCVELLRELHWWYCSNLEPLLVTLVRWAEWKLKHWQVLKISSCLCMEYKLRTPFQLVRSQGGLNYVSDTGDWCQQNLIMMCPPILACLLPRAHMLLVEFGSSILILYSLVHFLKY